MKPLTEKQIIEILSKYDRWWVASKKVQIASELLALQEEEKGMKVVYIAHPIGGDIKKNLEEVRQIGRKINIEEPNVIPFAHYFFDCYSLDDNVPEERERGIKNDIALFKMGFIDELRLYGNRISSGMKAEMELAKMLNIPIVDMIGTVIFEQGEPTKELCPICGRELTRTCFYCTKELCSPFNLQEKGEPTKDIINDDVIEKYVLKNYPVQIIGTGINKIDVNSYFRECLIKELKAMRDGTIAEWAKENGT